MHARTSRPATPKVQNQKEEGKLSMVLALSKVCTLWLQWAFYLLPLQRVISMVISTNRGMGK